MRDCIRYFVFGDVDFTYREKGLQSSLTFHVPPAHEDGPGTCDVGPRTGFDMLKAKWDDTGRRNPGFTASCVILIDVWLARPA
jgi:hypothetical protein